jgi:hypothetical protein
MKTSIFTIIILLSWSATVAQQPPPLEPVKLSGYANAKPAACAHRSAIADGIHQSTPADELIIVIARPGDGDTKSNLSWRRLHNIRAYWTEFLDVGYRRKPETIILAEGERVKGYGQLEFYVSGRLVEVLKVARNSDVDFSNCYPPDDSYIRKGVYNPCWVKSHRIFYPCRDRYLRRRNMR